MSLQFWTMGTSTSLQSIHCIRKPA